MQNEYRLVTLERLFATGKKWAFVGIALFVVWVGSASAQTPDAAVRFVRDEAATLIALSDDDALRKWVERDSSAVALRQQIEARINSRYPASMRDAKLSEAIAAEFDPFVLGKIKEVNAEREAFKCSPTSLFLPGSKVVSLESGTQQTLEQVFRDMNYQRLGLTPGSAAVVFAEIEYPASTVKVSNQASSNDPIYKGFAPFSWYWLRKAVVRFVVAYRKDTTITDVALGVRSGHSIDACDLVDLQIDGKAPTPAAFIRYGEVSQYTDIKLRFVKALSSETAVEGESLEVEVAAPVATNSREVVIAAGAKVKGRIIGVQKPGRGGRPGVIAFQIDSIPTASGEALVINQRFQQEGQSSDTAENLGVAGLLVRGKQAVVPAGSGFVIRLKSDQKVRLPEP